MHNKITWTTIEGHADTKDADWVWSVGLIGTAVIISSFLVGNMLLGIFSMVATLTIIIYGTREKDPVEVTLTNQGIIIGSQMFPYENILSFCMRRDGDKNILSLHTTSMMLPFVTIDTENIDPDFIRKYLEQFIDERHHIKTLADKVVDYFKL